MNTHRCLAGCGKTITWQFAICTNCEGIYGSKTETWPKWLRFLWLDELRERRQIRKSSTYEVSIDSEEFSEVDNGKVPRRRAAD